MFLWRPVLAEPPICTVADMDRLTLDDFADMHEALDLRDEVRRRANERAAANRKARRR